MKEFELIKTHDMEHAETVLQKARLLLDEAMEIFNLWLGARKPEEIGVEFDVCVGDEGTGHYMEEILEELSGVLVARCVPDSRHAILVPDPGMFLIKLAPIRKVLEPAGWTFSWLPND